MCCRQILVGAVAGVLSAWFAVASFAQTRLNQVPFDAVVVSPEALTRSGNGQRYYPTGRLRAGDRVRVRRVAPGGWLGIDPPPGSFSWIRAEYVQQTAPDRGVLTEDNIVVRVGSEFGDNHEVEQVRLFRGDEVRLLGRHNLPFDGQMIPVWKIAPPPGELRWIEAAAVRPLTAPAEASGSASVDYPNPAAAPSDNLPSFADQLGGQAVPVPGGAPGAGTASSAGRMSASPGAAGAVLERPLVRRPNENEDPFAAASPSLPPDSSAAPPSRPTPSASGTPADLAAPDRGTLIELTQQLQAVDDELQAILDRGKANWYFDDVEARYRDLHSRSPSQSLRRLIELRLGMLDRYREAKAEYDREVAEFRRIVAETDRRNAELRRRAATMSSPADGAPAASPSAVPSRVPAPTRGAPQTGRAPIPPRPSGTRPSEPANLPGPPRAPSTPAAPTNAARRVPSGSAANGAPAAGPRTGVPQFDGAGIVQRSATTFPGAPPFVLLAPNGRILAYLDSDNGVPLERYIGQSVGVFGPRRFRADLQADFLQVRGLMPVRLLPQ